MTLTLALAKGKLLAGAAELFRRAGVPFPEDPGRRLVVDHGGLRFLFVKDVDVPTYVEHGVADCGIAGRDVLLEASSDVYEPLDLRFGGCRLVVAWPRGMRGDPRSSTLRVATKYPRVTAAYFLERGVSVEVVRLAGSVELAPGLGLSDCIVDVVETGGTLEANGLVAAEEVAASSARFIVNRASFHAGRGDVAALMERLAEAVR
jgi:ATP phosphoribosyltransferase